MSACRASNRESKIILHSLQCVHMYMYKHKRPEATSIIIIMKDRIVAPHLEALPYKPANNIEYVKLCVYIIHVMYVCKNVLVP